MANGKSKNKKDYGNWGGATGIKVISRPGKAKPKKKGGK